MNPRNVLLVGTPLSAHLLAAIARSTGNILVLVDEADNVRGRTLNAIMVDDFTIVDVKPNPKVTLEQLKPLVQRAPKSGFNSNGWNHSYPPPRRTRFL